MNKRGEIYDQIIARLCSRTILFGDRLFVKQLGADLGVSRQPIMAALGRLEAEGFVRIIPQVGCEVVNPSRTDIADFFLLFERMQGLFAELAAERRTEAQLEELRITHRRIMATDFSATAAKRNPGLINRPFYEAIRVMARSSVLDIQQQHSFNMANVFLCQLANDGAVTHDSAQERQEIIDAISTQSPTRARMSVEAHIAGVARSALAAFPR